MICFEVSLNGNVLCNVGTAKGLVHVRLDHDTTFGNPRTEISLHETIVRPASTGEDLAPKLRAVLQHHERPVSTQPVYWIDRKKLKTGDEITIRLIDLPVNDPEPIPDSPPGSN